MTSSEANTSDRKTIVFGQDGQVAQSLKKHGLRATFIGRDQVDFTQPQQIEAVLQSLRPKLIVNASAYTQVDGAETNYDQAYAINASAPASLAKWCANNRSSLVHISTDYVYNGEGSNPWREDAEPLPLNAYGRSKLAGDQLIAESGCHHFILRTSWLYGPYGTNFVKTMLRLGTERETLRIVADQTGAPTSTLDLAEAIVKLITHADFQRHRGVYHVANSGATSWYEFACAIFELARHEKLALKVKEVLPISSAEYITPARRPHNSRLDTAKLRQDFNIVLPNWTSGLQQTLRILLVEMFGEMSGETREP